MWSKNVPSGIQNKTVSLVCLKLYTWHISNLSLPKLLLRFTLYLTYYIIHQFIFLIAINRTPIRALIAIKMAHFEVWRNNICVLKYVCNKNRSKSLRTAFCLLFYRHSSTLLVFRLSNASPVDSAVPQIIQRSF